MALLQKDRVMLFVNLVPNLLVDRRIAFFDENVYILYVLDMVRNVWVLL